MTRWIVWSLVVILSLAGQGITRAQTDEAQAILDELVADFAADADGAAVTALVAIEEEVWSAAAGFADVGRPATPSDRFRIGSTSKTFVAVVALRLVEQGQIELDAPVADYLPAEVVERIANVETVTLRQLLAMRSGIDDYLSTDEFWEAVADDPSYRWTAAEALTYAYDLPALFAPDAEFFYSNTNYLLAQLALERASGQPLETLIRSHILDPLGMDDTYTQIFETDAGGFVLGYEDFDGDGQADEVSGINDGAGLGDGGLISSVGDLATFYRALLVDKTVLSAESLEELLTFQEDDEGGEYSLGFGAWETDAGVAWGHSGAVSGFQSVALYLPDYDAIIVVLAASADLDPESLAESLIDELMED